MQKQSKKGRRQAHILENLDINPAMRVGELADKLDVSSETVRRDLAELDAAGRIRRTYGGAVRTTTFEPVLAERLKLHVTAREKIARHAMTLLEDADSLLIGGGATTLHFARALKSIDRQITVLTASFGIAIELATNPLIEVISLPGKVEPKEGLLHGPETLEYINRYRTPIAVMGASGIDETGVSEALLSAAQVYEAMIRIADHTIVLADGSKMGNRSLRQILSWGPDTTLVSDTAPTSAIRHAFDEAGAAFRIAT
ncbi:DeoR/GlpR transcriptional regulator [Rhodobacteraceae bacterium F11138]|nr:DeoR/GlpR transcriptional regulator [Rhodobacteraceae bacterium F11138]